MKTSNKVEFKEFIYELLKIVECEGIHESGDNFHCQCPFHKPHHSNKQYSSFGISFKSDNPGVYHCFSCHEQGNIFNLISFIYKCSFKEAKKIFKRKVVTASINLDSIKSQLNEIKNKNKIKDDIENIKIELPPKSNSDPMMEYLKERNETKQHEIMDLSYIVSRYELYYCNVGPFRRRIIMPIRSQDGSYIYFTNRAIDSWAKKNMFMKKSSAMNYVYGLYEAIGKKKAILTEGPFDLFQLKSYALKKKYIDFGFISSLGTEVQEERASLIAEFFDEIWICFDGDEEGVESARKVTTFLSDFVRTYNITERVYHGKDPAVLNEEQLDVLFVSNL